MFKVNKAQATLLKIVDNPSNVKKNDFFKLILKTLRALYRNLSRGLNYFSFEGRAQH